MKLSRELTRHEKRVHAMWKQYGGIDYDRTLELQSGVCAICLRPPKDGEYLVPDHNHQCCPSGVTATGRRKSSSCGACLRGLLCSRCNLMIGLAEENSEALRRAAAYIDRDFYHVVRSITGPLFTIFRRHGRVMTEETRQKLVDAQTAAWRRGRGPNGLGRHAPKG